MKKNEEKKWFLLDEKKLINLVFKETGRVTNNKYQNNSNTVIFYLANYES